MPGRNEDYRFSDLSNKSFASLILLARYGAPPRSGWLASMICLWASLIFIFRTGPSLKYTQSLKTQNSQEIERETHLRPRMERASFLSILALKPPLAHSWAAPLPPIIPLLISVRPAMAAAIAPTPRMIGVAIWEKTREDEVSEVEEVLLLGHVRAERHNLPPSEPLRVRQNPATRSLPTGWLYSNTAARANCLTQRARPNSKS